MVKDWFQVETYELSRTSQIPRIEEKGKRQIGKSWWGMRGAGVKVEGGKGEKEKGSCWAVCQSWDLVTRKQ